MRFTSANAREMAAKGLQARLQAVAEREEALARAAKAVEQAEATPKFILERLARVRLQLDRLDAMALKETDPQKLDRLASAQLRLSEQERILSGRPLPGSNRPRAEKPRRALAAPDPVETPQPVVSSVPPSEVNNGPVLPPVQPAPE